MVIYKYVVKPQWVTPLKIPAGSKVLSAKEQNGNVVLYVAHNKGYALNVTLNVYTIGTGHDNNFDINNLHFVDTVKLRGGDLMFHIFAEREFA